MSIGDKRIFDAVACVLPSMTCRLFSEYCGMSDGYWGSVQAQDLELSADALLHLAEMLEHKKSIGGRGVSVKGINQVQELIAAEIAERRERLNFTNGRVRRLVFEAMAKRSMTADQSYNLPPIILGWT